MKYISFLALVFFTTSLLAQSKVAIVKLLRGQAEALTLGNTSQLKIDDWVENGTVIKTEKNSYVKIIFLDKSQMNIGPSSQMKIEKFSNSETGVIDLVKGQIRSQVTKDYLKIKDKDRSKLIIKTTNAVMGVRGTYFLISTNSKSTTAVLFEGEVVFNKFNQTENLSAEKLDEIVNDGVKISPGEFSVSETDRAMPTIPSILSIEQKNQLEKNMDFSSERGPSSKEDSSAKSVVPDGLSGNVVSNKMDTIKNITQNLLPTEDKKNDLSQKSDPNGYIKGNEIKPANGSMVHLDSGVIIPPGSGAILDTNTNTFIPEHKAGSVGKDGNYIPPENIKITQDGRMFITGMVEGKSVQKEIPPPLPVVNQSSLPLGATSMTGPSGPAPTSARDIPLNIQMPPPNGGIQGINDPQRDTTNVSDTIIKIDKPNAGN